MDVSSARADLLSAFEDRRLLLARGRPVAVYTHHAGTLVLTSGRIVACNPLTLPPRPLPGAHLLVLLSLNHREPFSRTVPPGRYPVVLSVIRTSRKGSAAAHESIAMAMVRFEDTPPVRWERATRGEPARVLPAHQRYGYQADPDITAFLDADVVERVPERSRQFVDTFTNHSPPMWSSTALTLEPKSGGNVIAFSSGTRAEESMAHSLNSSWWGLGEDGRPVCLVTDFQHLDLPRPALPPDDAEARLGRVRDLELQVRYGDAEMRCRALREIGGYGGEASEAVELLIERILASESDSAEREYAAAAIARICAEAPEQVELLARALASPVSGEPLEVLLRAVGSIGICSQEARFFQSVAERILTVLIQRLEDGDRHIQGAIKSFVWDLGESRPEAWELLVRLLGTTDLELRVAAASRLSHSTSPAHHEAAQDALASIIMDELMELELRVASASSLSAFPSLSVSARTALWQAASSRQQPLLAWYARDLLRSQK